MGEDTAKRLPVSDKDRTIRESETKIFFSTREKNEEVWKGNSPFANRENGLGLDFGTKRRSVRIYFSRTVGRKATPVRGSVRQ